MTSAWLVASPAPKLFSLSPPIPCSEEPEELYPMVPLVGVPMGEAGVVAKELRSVDWRRDFECLWLGVAKEEEEAEVSCS